mgnify:CR=1 FL=1
MIGEYTNGSVEGTLEESAKDLQDIMSNQTDTQNREEKQKSNSIPLEGDFRHAEKTSSPDTQKGQMDQIEGVRGECGQSGEFVSEENHIAQENETGRSDDLNVPCRLPKKKLVRTFSQKRVMDYLISCGEHITINSYIARECGLAEGTVRNVLRHFKKHDLISIETKFIYNNWRLHIKPNHEKINVEFSNGQGD